MTGDQLTLGDCDPAWQRLTHRATQRQRDPISRGWHDLRAQLTKRQFRRMTTVKIIGDYL
ncbi:hypothetical protein [Streptomyces sp. 1222.5]|uniref:hypothetical protein n=1 Tax=Streptomyces sp. 1222.5 TaxID=1881026 RepID=UPI003D7618B4